MVRVSPRGSSIRSIKRGHDYVPVLNSIRAIFIVSLAFIAGTSQFLMDGSRHGQCSILSHEENSMNKPGQLSSQNYLGAKVPLICRNANTSEYGGLEHPFFFIMVLVLQPPSLRMLFTSDVAVMPCHSAKGRVAAITIS